MKNATNKPPVKQQVSYLNLFWMFLISVTIALLTTWPSSGGIIHAFSHQWFYTPFLGIFSTSLIYVWLVDQITIALDKKYRWEECFSWRCFYQFLYGWMASLTICVLCTWLYFSYLNMNILTILDSRHMVSLVCSLTLLVNVAYAAYYFFYFFRKGLRIANDIRPDQPYPDYLIFSDASSEIKVQVEDIAYLCSHGKHIALQFHSGQPIILASVSLTQTAMKLDPDQFLLVNRSYIIARRSYRGYRKKDRGLILSLEPKPQETVKISETKKPIFLDWIKEVSSSFTF